MTISRRREAASDPGGLDGATGTPRCTRWPPRWSSDRRDPRGQRARHGGRPRRAGLSAALLDRLELDAGAPGRHRLATSRTIAALPDPVGETLDGHRLENGLDVRRVRVPLGVVAVVYEARPNVTIDCSALCLKSGNAIVLRGSSMAAHSNAVLAQVAASEAARRRRPSGGRRLAGGRRRPRRAARARHPGRRRRPDHPARRRGAEDGAQGARHGAGDLRGGRQLPRLRGRRRGPRRRASAITLNAKVQRPSVCNAAETLLVHADVARRVPAARCCASCASPASSCGSTGARALAAGDAGRLADRRHRGGLGHRVPRADPGREGRRLGRGGDRAREPLRHGPLGGDRDRLGGGGARLHDRRRRRLRLRERVHALHRRRRVRDGRRDRQLHPEAARARADRRCASCAPTSTWSRAPARCRS